VPVRWRAGSDDHAGFERDDLCCELGQALCSSAREPIVDGDVLSLDVPDVGSTLLEGLELRRWARRAVEEEPDSGRLRRRDTRR